MKNRYTVRTFDSEKPVKDEDIKTIIEAGRLSPSKNDLYPYTIVTLTNSAKGREIKEKIWKEYSICFHCLKDGTKVVNRINSLITAPVVFLFFVTEKLERIEIAGNGKNVQVGKKSIQRRIVRDVMIPATVMMLQAEELGYGTAFTGISLEREKLAQEIGLPIGNEFVVALSVGVAKKIEDTKLDSPLELDYDCQGEMKSHLGFSVQERDSHGNPKVVSRTMNWGPRNIKKAAKLADPVIF